MFFVCANALHTRKQPYASASSLAYLFEHQDFVFADGHLFAMERNVQTTVAELNLWIVEVSHQFECKVHVIFWYSVMSMRSALKVLLRNKLFLFTLWAEWRRSCVSQHECNLNTCGIWTCLARCLCAFVKCTAAVQLFTVGGDADFDGAFWKLATRCVLPHKITGTQHFEFGFWVLFAVVADVRQLFVGNHLGWN